MNDTIKIIGRLTEELYWEKWKVNDFIAWSDYWEKTLVTQLETLDNFELTTWTFDISLNGKFELQREYYISDFLESNEMDNVLKLIDKYTDEQDIERDKKTIVWLTHYIVTWIK